jgi:hypothetical protein
MRKQVACLKQCLSPHKRICQVNLDSIQQEMKSVFAEWGLPQSMKFDNGSPFGDPGKEFVPVLCLWLKGLGIQPIWNRTRTPQDNAKVERMQGVSASWSQAKDAQNLDHLRTNLEQACIFQREKYPTRILKNRTRLEVYPNLLENSRKFDPEKFDFGQVAAFLESFCFHRRVSQVGQVNIANRRIQAGRKYARQNVYVKYNAQEHLWEILDEQNKLIRTQPALFSSDSIQNVSAFCKS